MSTGHFPLDLFIVIQWSQESRVYYLVFGYTVNEWKMACWHSNFSSKLLLFCMSYQIIKTNIINDSICIDLLSQQNVTGWTHPANFWVQATHGKAGFIYIYRYFFNLFFNWSVGEFTASAGNLFQSFTVDTKNESWKALALCPKCMNALLWIAPCASVVRLDVVI